MKDLTLGFSISKQFIQNTQMQFGRYSYWILFYILILSSALFYIVFYFNGLGLSYNDARSHLDIGRRVVEGLKPGLAQLGSVWLPLPHLLMIPTIWNDFMWHSGLAGAVESMASFVLTGFLIYQFLKKLKVGVVGRVAGVALFITNINIAYLQSTAMTELLLIATMTAAVYEFVNFLEKENILSLVKSSFWVCLATLVRYDGWFLFAYLVLLIGLYVFWKKGYKSAEGIVLFFSTLAGLGIVGWFAWNQLIFSDALYFVFGPYSAHAQQEQLEQAGVLITKGNLFLSSRVYLYALIYNTGTFVSIIGAVGAVLVWFDKRITNATKIAVSALFAPLVFNILALFLGHSVLFIQGISGNSWFNVRYGVMMIPTVAIFAGYLVDRASFFRLKYVILSLLLLVSVVTYSHMDAVTLDDARVGSSQKNVREVSSWLAKNAKDKPGFILISAASHDAIIFSSGLPMKRFIHEGTGAYWVSATTSPDRWARWIIMRTNDDSDQTFRFVKKTSGFSRYVKVESFPFADIYELKSEYLGDLNTKPVFLNQK